jgi:anti-sigma factor RsiW
MNCEKAQELFSELHEGTLSDGLKQAAARHISECPACDFTYRTFEETYKAISDMPPVSAPSELREEISRRLDKADWDRRQAAPATRGWLKVAVLGAAAVIAGVVFWKAPFSQENGVGANFVGVPTVKHQPLTLKRVGAELHLRMVASSDTRIAMYQSGSDYSKLPPADAVPTRTDMARAGQRYDARVDVDDPNPAALWLTLQGDKGVVAIFSPQESVRQQKAFDGNIPEILQAIANTYAVTVEAKLTSAGPTLAREISGDDIAADLNRGLAGTGLSFTIDDKIVKID